MATKFGQLAIGWCLDHLDAEAGYAQCVSKVVCKAPGQASQAETDPVACVSYGECDCSQIKDEDSVEYFQCISNPNYTECTSVSATPATSTSSFYELETLTPGTYTLDYDGTTKTVVVPSPTATITDFATVTAMSTMTVTVTMEPTGRTTTKTSKATSRTTLVPTPTRTTATSISVPQTTPNTTSSTTSTPTDPPTCPSYCDCEPKYGDPDDGATKVSPDSYRDPVPRVTPKINTFFCNRDNSFHDASIAKKKTPFAS